MISNPKYYANANQKKGSEYYDYEKLEIEYGFDIFAFFNK